MAIDRNKPSISDRIAATEKLYSEAELGVSADAVLRALDPMIERRLGLLLDKFAICPPELGPLLELKAQISEIWRIRSELRQARARGQSSWEALQAILVEKGGVNGRSAETEAGGTV